MTTHRCCLLLFVVAVLAAPSAVAQPAPYVDPARVLVVYDLNFPDSNGNSVGDSVEVALAYQAKRAIPAANMLAVTCSTTKYYYDSAGWTAFYNEVRNPVVNALTTLGLTAIDTILFCHGVPYQLSLSSAQGGTRSLDQAMMTPFSLGSATAPAFPSYWATSTYCEKSPGYSSDKGHFDHALYKYLGNECYLVARLDAADVDRVLDLIEGARYGERYIATTPGFYQGNIYVDTRYGPYTNLAALPYPQNHNSYAAADEDMAWCTQLVANLGFPFLWENAGTDKEIGEAGAMFQNSVPALSAPDALFYYGWYNYNKYLDVWSFLPGSAACDLNSNSVAGIRSTAPTSFLANAFLDGLTCAAGCIAEPYLTGHPYPETFIHYLLNGFSFAEAAAVSDPGYLWRSLYVGDPLYCPLPLGKTPQLDQVQPPAPSLEYAAGDGITETWRLRIDTSKSAPDLVKVNGTYGVAPLIDQAVPQEKGYRMAPPVVLSGLAPGLLYRAALEVVDPVGNATAAPEIVFINDGGSGTAAVVQAFPTAASAYQPITVEFGARVPGGLANLTGFQMTLDAPHLGIYGLSLIYLLPALPAAVHGDVITAETLSVEIGFPGLLPAGNYTFNLNVISMSGTAADSLVIPVS